MRPRPGRPRWRSRSRRITARETVATTTSSSSTMSTSSTGVVVDLPTDAQLVALWIGEHDERPVVVRPDGIASLLPVRRRLNHGRRDGHLVRVSVQRAQQRVQRLPEDGRLADPARVHDDREPVPRRGLRRCRRVGVRARSDDRDGLPDCPPGRTNRLLCHAPTSNTTQIFG